VGFVKPELISAAYAELNARLHKENIAYGVGGGKHAPIVQKLCESLKTRSVLDYGCGKGYLAKALDFPIWEYDPAIPGKDADPRPADLVVSTDVLEHVEPERLDFVLADLRRVVRKVGYFTIATKPAMKFLADGRNAHLIQEGADWWRARLSKFFTVAQITPRGPELHVVVGPKRKAQTA
jgi:2-polyprenyl-3-methyl-5-hydroxy-6-metoxy-1,4-benzoquinol methylase